MFNHEFRPPAIIVTNLAYGFIMVGLLVWSTLTHADVNSSNSPVLAVTPEQCIALHKGQMCYLDVTFRWQTNNVGNVCLVNVSDKISIECWHGKRSGQISFEFSSTTSKNYVLRTQLDETVLGNVRINVVWVYNSSPRSKASWRLF